MGSICTQRVVETYSSAGDVVVSSVAASSLDFSQPVRIVLPHTIKATTLNIANALRMIDLHKKVSIVIGMPPSRLSILGAVQYTIGVILAFSARAGFSSHDRLST